jgi:tRNA threonylcarbamoyladenosine biosynthesis protein TsaB
LVWARYEASGEDLTPLRPPRNGTPSELVEELRGSGLVLVTGEIDDDQARIVAQVDGVLLPPAAVRRRQSGAFAELAWRRWRAGDVDEASALEPVYLSR